MSTRRHAAETSREQEQQPDHSQSSKVQETETSSTRHNNCSSSSSSKRGVECCHWEITCRVWLRRHSNDAGDLDLMRLISSTHPPADCHQKTQRDMQCNFLLIEQYGNFLYFGWGNQCDLLAREETRIDIHWRWWWKIIFKFKLDINQRGNKV